MNLQEIVKETLINVNLIDGYQNQKLDSIELSLSIFRITMGQRQQQCFILYSPKHPLLHYYRDLSPNSQSGVCFSIGQTDIGQDQVSGIWQEFMNDITADPQQYQGTLEQFSNGTASFQIKQRQTFNPSLFNQFQDDSKNNHKNKDRMFSADLLGYNDNGGMQVLLNLGMKATPVQLANEHLQIHYTRQLQLQERLHSQKTQIDSVLMKKISPGLWGDIMSSSSTMKHGLPSSSPITYSSTSGSIFQKKINKLQSGEYVGNIDGISGPTISPSFAQEWAWRIWKIMYHTMIPLENDPASVFELQIVHEQSPFITKSVNIKRTSSSNGSNDDLSNSDNASDRSADIGGSEDSYNTSKQKGFWIHFKYNDQLFRRKIPSISQRQLKETIVHYKQLGQAVRKSREPPNSALVNQILCSLQLKSIYPDSSEQQASVSFSESSKWSSVILHTMDADQAPLEDHLLLLSQKLIGLSRQNEQLRQDIEFIVSCVRKRHPSLLIWIKPILTGTINGYGLPALYDCEKLSCQFIRNIYF